MSRPIRNPGSSSFSTVKDQVLYNESNGEVTTIQNGMVISVDHPLPRPANFVGRPRRTPIVNAPEETPYIVPTINYGDGSPSFAAAAGSAVLGHENTGEGETPYVAPTMDHSQGSRRSDSAISTLVR